MSVIEEWHEKPLEDNRIEWQKSTTPWTLLVKVYIISKATCVPWAPTIVLEVCKMLFVSDYLLLKSVEAELILVTTDLNLRKSCHIPWLRLWKELLIVSEDIGCISLWWLEPVQKIS